jgi:hypothetical protein
MALQLVELLQPTCTGACYEPCVPGKLVWNFAAADNQTIVMYSLEYLPNASLLWRPGRAGGGCSAEAALCGRSRHRAGVRSAVGVLAAGLTAGEPCSPKTCHHMNPYKLSLSQNVLAPVQLLECAWRELRAHAACWKLGACRTHTVFTASKCAVPEVSWFCCTCGLIPGKRGTCPCGRDLGQMQDKAHQCAWHVPH